MSKTSPVSRATGGYSNIITVRLLKVYVTVENEVFHVLFAVDMPAEQTRVIIAYRPDPEAWKADQKTRRLQ